MSLIEYRDAADEFQQARVAVRRVQRTLLSMQTSLHVMLGRLQGILNFTDDGLISLPQRPPEWSWPDAQDAVFRHSRKWWLRVTDLYWRLTDDERKTVPSPTELVEQADQMPC
jgi:hypothetical protein